MSVFNKDLLHAYATVNGRPRYTYRTVLPPRYATNPAYWDGHGLRNGDIVEVVCFLENVEFRVKCVEGVLAFSTPLALRASPHCLHRVATDGMVTFYAYRHPYHSIRDATNENYWNDCTDLKNRDCIDVLDNRYQGIRLGVQKESSGNIIAHLY